MKNNDRHIDNLSKNKNRLVRRDGFM